MNTSVSNNNKLGLWTGTSLVVGNMIGSGVFLMPAQLATFGGISILGWIFSAIGAFLLAKIFSNLSKLVPDADGGPYAYSKTAMGVFSGYLVGWGYLVSTWCTNAALAVAFVSAMSTFFPLFATNNILAVSTGLFAICFLTWINTRGISASGRMQLFTTLLKLIPLVVVSVAGLFFMDFNNFIPFNISGMSNFGAITATATLTFFAFQGIECATIPSTSMENPEVNISRATMIGTTITTIIYIISSVSIMGLISAKQLALSPTPFADAALIMFGSGSEYWIGAGVAIAAFGALNGFILIQGQVGDALSKDGLFPSIFSKHNKNGVPGAGIVIGSCIASVIMMMNYSKGLVTQFKFLILLSTFTVLVPYLFSAASYLIIKIKNSNYNQYWIPSALLALSSFLYSLWAVAGAGEDTVYWGFLMLMAGIPIYVWMEIRNHIG
ncbi:MAG: amino acid permease [Saprospiraceae bacterium]|nr:amino acid permease [Saprospiraceae bacterium]